MCTQGHNFGALLGTVASSSGTGAKVRVGGASCGNLVVAVANGFENITCSMPAGSGITQITFLANPPSAISHIPICTGIDKALVLSVSTNVLNFPTRLNYSPPAISFVANQLGSVLGAQLVLIVGKGLVNEMLQVAC